MTAVPVVHIAVPFLIKVPADMLIFAHCPFASPAIVTGADLYKIFGFALVMAGIEKLFGVALEPLLVVIDDIVNDSTSDVL